MLAEIIGPDLLIVLALVLVLFGGSQLPKLARGLGSAQHEFKKGLEGSDDDEPKGKTPKARKTEAPKAVESSDSENESSTETD